MSNTVPFQEKCCLYMTLLMNVEMLWKSAILKGTFHNTANKHIYQTATETVQDVFRLV